MKLSVYFCSINKLRGSLRDVLGRWIGRWAAQLRAKLSLLFVSSLCRIKKKHSKMIYFSNKDV